MPEKQNPPQVQDEQFQGTDLTPSSTVRPWLCPNAGAEAQERAV